ncbi:MAG TPA: glycosyltransferase family 2 protein [Humibacter sp.]|nr:glycosyltransferase family 2 protein [Humibacter sp.]
MSGEVASGATEPEDRDAPSVGVVVLSQGTRPAELRSSLQSILNQTGVRVDVVCVGNGWRPRDLPQGVRGLALDRNVGIPAGRNAGVPATAGDYLLFLDDDERLASDRFVADAIELMRRHPDVGMVQPRIVDPTGRAAPRRWVPRLRKGSPEHSSNVFSVLEGAIVMPRAVFERAGGWAAPFFYAHEGIELAWRVWDQGLRVWYAGDLVAEHPAVETTRHAEYYRMNARNRVWLARRNLPALFIPVYVGTWTGVQVLRGIRSPRDLRAWFAGWREGWRTDPGERRPIRWLTVWRMTRHGRPPII